MKSGGSDCEVSCVGNGIYFNAQLKKGNGGRMTESKTRATVNYASKARSDAADMVEYFVDEIVEQLVDSGEASDDFNNDYPEGDSYHHEQHVDKAYTLTEAAAILDQLSRHEESDEGLWDGLAPREAISCQAAYTYGNAVAYEWSNLIALINTDPQIGDALVDLTDGVDNVTADTIEGLVLNLVKEG